MDDKSIRLLKQKRTRQNFAKQIALYCFRNTFLEDIHAGIDPRSRTGDYSDVKVVTPDKEIPWNEVSRISARVARAVTRRGPLRTVRGHFDHTAPSP